MSIKALKIENYVANEQEFPINENSLLEISSKRELIELLKGKNIRYENSLDTLSYEKELVQLQIELVRLQQWIKINKRHQSSFSRDILLQVRWVFEQEHQKGPDKQ